MLLMKRLDRALLQRSRSVNRAKERDGLTGTSSTLEGESNAWLEEQTPSIVPLAILHWADQQLFLSALLSRCN